MTAPWIIKNKGVRPWPFTKQLPKYGYRNNPRWVSLEGNRVIKNSPVWPMDEGKMTAVDASKHIPCGYWFGWPGSYGDGPDIPPVGIGYTTPQMPAGGIQTLTPVDPNGNPVPRPSSCRWVVLSGGGSVTQDGVYTAPATNPNCENNATIGLVCDGVVVDTVEIAINTYANLSITAYEYRELGDLYIPCCWSGIGWSAVYFMSLAKYNCRGDRTYYIGNAGCALYNVPPTCPGSNCGGYSGCSSYTFGFRDFRTPAMKAAGCCPAPLM